MSRFVKTAKTLRNHWKKSTFAAALVAYGANSAKTKYDVNCFMEEKCKEAAKFGEEYHPLSINPRSVTVILNPAANKRSAKADYEKYCEPLLHMAGITVNLLQTNSEGHAKELVDKIPQYEPIIVAGGDGTLSETLTGLLRKNENNTHTIGVLPLGRTNVTANKLFPRHGKLPKVQQLADATMAVIKSRIVTEDVMKIESITNDQEAPIKPIFAISSLEWGAFRDALARRDKYWYYGGFRDYVTFIFNGYKNSLCWDCKAEIKYSPPCDGCNKCKKSNISTRKGFHWSDLIKLKTVEQNINVKDYSEIFNPDCGKTEEECFKTVGLKIEINQDENNSKHLSLKLSKMGIGYKEFVSEGWNLIKTNNIIANRVIEAGTIELSPKTVPKEGQEIFYNIDNEEFDMKPVKITLVPNSVNMFCKPY